MSFADSATSKLMDDGTDTGSGGGDTTGGMGGGTTGTGGEDTDMEDEGE